MSTTIYAWIGIAILALIIEAVTCCMEAGWFAVGSLLAIGCERLGLMLEIQIILCFVSSMALMYYVRPYLLKWMNLRKMAKARKEKTNEL